MIEGLRNSGIQEFRDSAIHLSVNLIDRIPLIPKFLNSQFLTRINRKMPKVR